MQLGFFAGLPLLLSVLGDLFGGVTTDAVTRRFGLRLGRVGLQPIAQQSRPAAHRRTLATCGEAEVLDHRLELRRPPGQEEGRVPFT